jgi:hypothetical protein
MLNVQPKKNILVKLDFLFGRKFFTGLSHSLVALTFKGVTVKNSSSILIYYDKGTDIYTENELH